MPFGRGWIEDRYTQLSDTKLTSIALRNSGRQFATNSNFLFERYDLLRRKKATSHLFGMLKYTPGLIGAIASVTPAELKIGLDYYDKLRKSKALNTTEPVKPSISPSVDLLIRSVKTSKRHLHNSDSWSLENRNRVWAVMSLMGSFTIFDSCTVNDLENTAHARLAGLTNAYIRANAAKSARAVSQDPVACAQFHKHLLNCIISHLIGWDRKSGEAKPEGGIFGIPTAFIGPSEEQQRQSLHNHFMITLRSFPLTTEQLLDWLTDASFTTDFETYVGQTVCVDHGIPQADYSHYSNGPHEDEVHGVDCKELAESSVTGLHQDVQTCFGAVPAITGVPETPCFKPIAIPSKYKTMTKPQKGIKYPLNMRCRSCSYETSSYDLQKAWALKHAGKKAVAAYEASPGNIYDIKINICALMGLKSERAQLKAVAILALSAFENLLHDPGHRTSCFKGKRECRFGAPYSPTLAVGIMINHVIVSALSPLSVKLSTNQIFQILMCYGPCTLGSEYTSKYNLIQYAATHCQKVNINTQVIGMNPSQVYYVTKYCAKIVYLLGAAVKMVQALERKIEQDLQSEQPQSDFGRSASILTRLRNASTFSLEVPSTMAALYFINDTETFHFSHSFVSVPAFGLIQHYCGNPYSAPCSTNSTTGDYTAITKASDYADRGPELEDMCPYILSMWYYKVNGPLVKSSPPNKIKFKDSHPQSSTHYLQKLRKFKIPVLRGRRILDRKLAFEFDTPDDIRTDYCLYALAIFSSWRYDPKPESEAYSTYMLWEQPSEATTLLNLQQNYWDQKRIAAADRATARKMKEQFHGSTVFDADDFDDSSFDEDAEAEPYYSKPRAALPQLSNAVSENSSIFKSSQSAQVDVEIIDAKQAVTHDWDIRHPLRTGLAPIVESTWSTPITAAAELIIKALQSPLQPAMKTAELQTQPTFAQVLVHFRMDTDTDQAKSFTLCAVVLLRHWLKTLIGSSQMWPVEADQALALLEKHSAPEQLCLYVGGAGGCGKSNVISAVREFARKWSLSSSLGIAAFTGSAASLVRATTLHRLLQMNITSTSDSNDKSLHQNGLVAPNACFALVLVDEISFVDAAFLQVFSYRMQVLRGAKHDPQFQKPFGGVSVAVFGDFLQLNSPMSAATVYDYDKLTCTKSKLSPHATAGIKLWRSAFVNVVFLKKNYRAIADPSYAQFLLRFRQGHISVEDMHKLSRCRVSSTRKMPLGAPMIFPYNMLVNSANFLMALKSGNAENKTIFRLPTIVRASDTKTPVDTSHLNGYTLGDDSGTDPLIYTDVYLGCPMIVRGTNDHCTAGFSNGSVGFLVGSTPNLTDLPYTDWREPIADPSAPTTIPVRRLSQLPTHLLVYIPGCTLQFAGLSPGVIPVPQTTTKSRYIPGVLPGRSTVRITHFDVRHGFAFTCHKGQGRSLEILIVGKFSKSFLHYNYVVLSRAISWDSVYILDAKMLTSAALVSPPHMPLCNELSRLAELAAYLK
jgi:hypothetical protein